MVAVTQPRGSDGVCDERHALAGAAVRGAKVGGVDLREVLQKCKCYKNVKCYKTE